MRRPLIAGNWKMNTNVSEAVELASNIATGIGDTQNIDCVVCPPFVSLQPVSEVIKGYNLQIGAQNMYFKEKGAFTGEIAPVMLQGLCQFVIIGHSERRQYFGETDATVNSKVKAALTFDLLPIMCIGESLSENENNATRDVLSRQLSGGLSDISGRGDLVIAYEPIWAIGTGRAATGVQAGETISYIRKVLVSIWGTSVAEQVRILYGGSVTAGNILEFVTEKDIDGALVGGASLKAEEFISIIKQTAYLNAGQ